jgi:hypothetical protein
MTRRVRREMGEASVTIRVDGLLFFLDVFFGFRKETEPVHATFNF